MRRFRFVAVLLSLALLSSLVLSISGAPPAEAGGNNIKNKFDLVENPDLVQPPPALGASGEGKIDFNTKKGEFNLTVTARGLVPGTIYRVRQTVRNGTAGDTPADADVLDEAVVADSNGEIKFTKKHVELNLLNIGPGPNWRIDQQIVLAGTGHTPNCIDCILVCSPTTKVSLVDGKLVEGWVP